MEKTQMLISKRVEGEVNYNDGSFAEVLTFGTDGDEKGLELEAIQLHIEDTEDTPDEFQQFGKCAHRPARRRNGYPTA